MYHLNESKTLSLLFCFKLILVLTCCSAEEAQSVVMAHHPIANYKFNSSPVRDFESKFRGLI